MPKKNLEEVQEAENLKEEDTTKDKFLTFVVDKEEYGVEIINIKEIISVTDITKVPDTPSYVEGIINLRGDIIPVLNVRKRFSKEIKEYDELTCIIVIEYHNETSNVTDTLGLIVDAVKEVMFIKEHDILPPPSAKINYHNQYIRNIARVGDSIKLILDLNRVLYDEE